MGETKESRKDVIGAIATPIQLAALIVLVVEGILAFLLYKSDAKDIKLYVILMVAILFITIVAVFFLETKRLKLSGAKLIPETGAVENEQKTYTYDIFLAAPMAALNDTEFTQVINKIKEIKQTLEVECRFKNVFFAGTNMKTKDDFDSADISIETDVNALKESRYFMMVYPEKIVTSVLFEAGIAFALGKPSFYFGHSDNFPFLMRQANQKFNHVKIYEALNHDDIIKMLVKNKAELFSITKAKI